MIFIKIINILNEQKFLEEYIIICHEEWGSEDKTFDLNSYITMKKNKILNEDKVILILGLIKNEELIGFISLFKEDGEYKKELTPWYATMYVKKEYRGKGYSKLLNESLLKETKKLGYDKVYLKSTHINYYEKFGAKYIENINKEEKLYYIDLKEIK